MVEAEDRAAVALGRPSYVWRFGQDRRLALIEKHVPLAGARILDAGCGIGAYVRKLRDLSERTYGIDVDAARLRKGAQDLPCLALASAEALPFASSTFDVILSNEVLEHVADDRQAVREAYRVLRPGGHIVIYVPNRLFPFETHGVYLGERFIFGNIPLVGYLPNPLRRKLVPHARAYLKRDLRRLVQGLGAQVVVDSYVYPGFDNIRERRRLLGTILRGFFHRAEKTPLRVFGLSHLLIIRKPVSEGGNGG